MTVFVTGGAGYIGSHTCVELLQAGYDVIIADDLSNASAEVPGRIETITGRAPVFYRVNVCDKDALRRIFAAHSIDAVIHFAGFKAVGESCTVPLRYYRNNLDSTLTLLEVMESHGCNQLVFSSSATVYGTIQKMPLQEDFPLGCTNPYGWTKYMSEQIFRDVGAANYGMSIVLLRYFNPVGAHESGRIGEDPNGIPNNLMPFICQVAKGRLEQLSVFGNDYPTPDGTGVRDYIHVMDLAEGHLAALKYAREHRGVEVFNLGTGVGYSVLEMVHTFEEVNGVRVPYRIAPRRPGDIATCYADPTKAHELLHWQTHRSLSDMCRDAWRWQDRNPMGYR